jgi:hypothetical protein
LILAGAVCVAACAAPANNDPGGDANGGDGTGSCDPGAWWGDFGDGDVAAFALLEACVTGLPPYGRVVEYLNFANASGWRRVRIARRWIDGPTVGETLALELAGFAIVDEGAVACLLCPSDLDYAYGHHNWQEQATAQSGTTEYQLTMVYGVVSGAWNDDLTAVDTASSAIRFGPEPLTAVSCATDPPGNPNFCMLRPRID